MARIKKTTKAAEQVTAFDAAFFERYYGNTKTRVADHNDAERLAALIAGVVGYIGLNVRRILDAGCGIGLLREPLLRLFPQATYDGLEVSAYLCARYGWIQGSVSDYSCGLPYDLVICHDVLQYLPDRAAAKALANLATFSRGALYLSVLTARDWRQAADQARTDRQVALRRAEWYQRRLQRRFLHVGMGVHVVKPLKPILWELETPWR
jgi:2-polyprenyl-3-methyl-5-hydroxy-6-metoxy-1,4-benzoquinol methylase